MYSQTLTQPELDEVMNFSPRFVIGDPRLVSLAWHLQNPLWAAALLQQFNLQVFNCSCWYCDGHLKVKRVAGTLSIQDFYLKYLSDIIYGGSHVMLN
jgi:hypothetical protein